MPDWRGSTRRSRLPSDWADRRQACRSRAGGRCEWRRVLNALPDLERWWRARHPGLTLCRQVGTDADHVHRGDDHSPGNLAWLCRRHHAAKSAYEGGTSGPGGATRYRPAERHPGIIPPTIRR